MKRQELKTNQTRQLELRKETLRRLDDSELQGAVGAARVRVPVGFDENTTPIYEYVDEP